MNLDRILGKIKHVDGRQWGGYVQPAEALAILKAGGQVKPDYFWKTSYLEEMVKKGESNPQWFYFTVKPNSELERTLSAKKVTYHARKGKV